MERMLINATQPEELRVAIVKDNVLQNLDIEYTNSKKTKSNIYKAKVSRVEPSLGAAFVEYGAKKQGFLPLKEIAPAFYNKKAQEVENPTISDLLAPGQEIMVQVDKIERGNKGAALTTYISIAGCYLVLMPYSPETEGVSRKIEGEDREAMKAIIDELQLPKGTGVILRTAGLGRSADLLRWDLEIITNQWKAIEEAYTSRSAPFLIYQDSDIIIRSIRDNLKKEIDDIVIDDSEIFSKAKKYIETVRPDFTHKLKLYQDNVPLFTRFNIEHQIESAHQREITLPSGGSIVIDKTEALYSIDINSAKSTKGADIEETALNTNMEAAVEIARQIKIRDIGGLVVIDFIDMNVPKNQKQVETSFKELIKNDKARIQVGKISKFGLLEFSRQRIRPALSEFSNVICPRCDGFGTVRNISSLGLSMLRIIEENCLDVNVSQIYLQTPPEVATYLLNEKRELVQIIQNKFDVKIVIIPNHHLVSPDYKIEVFNEDNQTLAPLSYKRIIKPKVDIISKFIKDEIAAIPAVKSFKIPTRPSKWQWIFDYIGSLFFGSNNNKRKPQNYNKKSKRYKARKNNK